MADKSLKENGEHVRRIQLDPSSPPFRSIVRVVFVLIAGLVLSYGLFSIVSQIRSLIFMIILSIFLAYLIDPLVRLIRRPFKERNLEKMMPRSFAIVIAYIVVFSVVGFAISYLAPRVAEQARQFANNVPAYAKSVQVTIANLATKYESYQLPVEIEAQISERITNLGSSLAEAIPVVLAAIALVIVSYLPWLILVPILSFFFLKDIQLFRASFLKAFPSGHWRARAELFLADVNTTLAAYTRAQMISCVLIGTVCTAGFYLFGINYALLLGIIAGILEFIPLIGPITIGITATTVAAVSDSPWKALYVAIFLVVLRIIHDYVTYPRIVRGGIHLHPLAIIISVLAGEQIAGIAGVFLSIPIVALVTVIYKHVLAHSGMTGLFAGWIQPAPAILLQDPITDEVDAE